MVTREAAIKEHKAGVKAGEWAARPGVGKDFDRRAGIIKAASSFHVKAKAAQVQKAKTISAEEKKVKSIMVQAAKDKRAEEKASKERLSLFQKGKKEFQQAEIKGRKEDRKEIKGIITARTSFENVKLSQAKQKLSQAKHADSIAERKRKLKVKQRKEFLKKWNAPFKNRKVLRKGPRPTLDLRQRPEREVPVKQHGFKEMDISNSNFLFN